MQQLTFMVDYFKRRKFSFQEILWFCCFWPFLQKFCLQSFTKYGIFKSLCLPNILILFSSIILFFKDLKARGKGKCQNIKILQFNQTAKVSVSKSCFLYRTKVSFSNFCYLISVR